MNTEQFNGHSPGPWAVGTTDYETQFVVFTMKVKSGLCGWPIALTETDTHLIAAAPELLAALIEERKMHERLREVVDDAQFLIRDHYDPAASVAYLQIARMLKEALHGGEEE